MGLRESWYGQTQATHLSSERDDFPREMWAPVAIKGEIPDMQAKDIHYQ